MKIRSKFFSIFQSFFNEIKNQFGVSIQILRSDNACEYISHSFNTFMKSHGILHLTSCTYTPQQNRVIERKNRHLVETTHTLLIHGGVPQRFWGDVILSACYLTNCKSFTILNNKISHSILFPHEPFHLLPLKVFGSSCFVHNFGPGLHKLFVRSHKCVFLGFTKSQKVYNISHPLLTVTSFLQMSHLLILLFILSLYLLHLCLHLSKYIFQLSLILQLCLVYLKIPLIHHLFKFTVIIRLFIVHLVTLLVSALPLSPSLTIKLDLPIIIRNSIRSTRNPPPHYIVLSYHKLSQPFYTCLLFISFVSIQKSVGDALAHPGWRQVMFDEISALQNSGTWELVPLSAGKLLLVAGGFLLSKLVLMVLLIVSKLILWLKVIQKF